MKDNIGKELKSVRESKGLLIQKVSEDTKIPVRALVSLESGNFRSFPSETYALGFLRRYARYLGIDDDGVIRKYKSNQMMEIETPIAELTQIPVKIMDHIKNQFMPIMVGALLILLSFGIYYQFFKFDGTKKFSYQKESSDVTFNILNYLKDSGKVPEEKTDSVSFANGIIISLIAKKEGIAFLLDGSEVYIILEDLQYHDLVSDQNQASLVVYPGKKKVSLNESTPSVINFPWLATKFKIYVLGATPNNIKIKIEKLGKNDLFDEKYITPKNHTNDTETTTENVGSSDQNNQIINPDNFTIHLVVKTIRENYVEFYIDGKQKRRGIVPAGETLDFEANHSIQMKIGDAGAIDVIVNGKHLERGKKGQQVNKIIRKVKDPLEQLKYHLEIRDT